MAIIKYINLILAFPLRGLVWLYQKTFSFDHGPLRVFYPYGYCKFYPSCSAYAELVLRNEGVAGLPKIIKRLIKCRPGVAPVIDQP
ncbi:MAG: hypothetical protein A3B10_00045 [Candidatus Doudnabacteria bacterium RIFCSPLOWO2_01_FULL_44_21]|uniref:Membrane protein insertion efficiency factor n=1 Tax=Candidatus Doudnabacteria bacterium RIFCSPLOWO2_01_FULL_44_21 TaxID=1817841 RepID=A0A1F5PY78_9BACT|nr:MAG: hypothetical protein A3B95_03500 [Candidatus Doudnabacteria bacterium RIFCSPHIGHO2_02_FULL_43_13b]OGE94540.1 MAG: hypothetical protein A3B10_00045 [Candidatus Doudnabacteria bacterium RIFCSPLOWO2_01_FULL_44_21]